MNFVFGGDFAVLVLALACIFPSDRNPRVVHTSIDARPMIRMRSGSIWAAATSCFFAAFSAHVVISKARKHLVSYEHDF